MAARLVLAYSLREGVTREAFERWVREEDAPFVRARPTVRRYEVYRVDGQLEGTATMDYLEIVDVTDLAADQARVAQPPGDRLDAAWRSMTRDPMIVSVSMVTGMDDATERVADPSGTPGSDPTALERDR